MSEVKHVKCPHDGYTWTTRSKLTMVTCPSCYHKFRVQDNLVKEDFLVLEHFNVDEKGVRILDRSLTSNNSPKGRIIDVYFKGKTAYCEYDESSDCKHIEYALSLPVVQEILKKKGWKL